MTLKENADGTTGLWSQAIFTPGSFAMNFINKYYREHMHEYPGIASFSGTDEPYEGEHKIIRDCKKHSLSERIAIVGKDGDLLLLGMGLTEQNVTILRHDDKKDTNGYLASDKILEVSCVKLRELIQAEMRLDEIWSFIIATFLVGNDFLPGVPECSDIYKALPRIIRSRVKLYDPRTKSIRWKGIFLLARKLSYKPKYDEKWVGDVEDPLTFDSLYYVTYCPFPVDKYLLVRQWLITIEWIFRYYHDGVDTASVAWQFNSTIAPTLHTIIEVGESAVNNLHLATEKVPPLSEVQCLAAVLPTWLHSLLPEHVRKAVAQHSKYYPLSFNMNEALDYPIIPTIPYSIISTFPRE
jgi:5'-3' exonuclease